VAKSRLFCDMTAPSVFKGTNYDPSRKCPCMKCILSALIIRGNLIYVSFGKCDKIFLGVMEYAFVLHFCDFFQ
jgi:hypothetical protein